MSEACWYCEKDIAEGEKHVGVFETDGPERAHESCRDNANEAAYDRSVSDFYGASNPQTDRERGAIAAEEKRRLG